jgi:hypothetical protein
MLTICRKRELMGICGYYRNDITDASKKYEMSLKIFTRHYYGDKIKEHKKEW